jgi:hypothetical protein
MPSRRVLFELTVRPYGSSAIEERISYGKVFVDADGNAIARDSEYFRTGVRAQSDTRIGPDETRVESFRYPVARDATVQVGIRLIYEHLPMGVREGGSRLTFYTESRTLLPEGKAQG